MIPGGNNPLSTLSGESRWDNDGQTTSYAGFAQLGFKITEGLKISAGVRYTHDEKEGSISALVVETGDRFNPNDPRANVTIESLCRAPDGTIIRTAPTGRRRASPPAPPRTSGPTARAKASRPPMARRGTETTPQAMIEWKISDSVFTYFTYSEGFKGGGFDDTPANVPQATTPFDPESAKNYELGIKSDLFDRRLRINADVFTMDYEDLQVTQTNAACLCNLTDNAASAKIEGVEAEFTLAATDNLRLSLGGSYVDAKYEDFLESAIIPTTASDSTAPATGCNARRRHRSAPCSITRLRSARGAGR